MEEIEEAAKKAQEIIDKTNADNDSISLKKEGFFLENLI